MQSPVPTFAHSLKALSAILKKAEASCAAQKIDPAVMAVQRLYPNMLPLTRQVLIACDHAKGAAARLSGTENPSFADTETTFADLQARIQKTLDFIATVPEAAFKDAETRVINWKAGSREMSMPGAAYLSFYALPNFYFHMTTAYNILRHNGVEIGKVDFLGA